MLGVLLSDCMKILISKYTKHKMESILIKIENIPPIVVLKVSDPFFYLFYLKFKETLCPNKS